MINELMIRVFEYVCRQQHVTLNDLQIFMKQNGLQQVSSGQGQSIQNLVDEDYSRII